MLPLCCRRPSLRTIRRSTRLISSFRLDFDDTKSAYALHSDGELLRSILVLRLSAIDSFVDNSPAILDVAQRFLPSALFDGVMRRSFFGQFVAGSSHDDVTKTHNEKFVEVGICSMPGPSIEDLPDDEQSLANEDTHQREILLDENVHAFLDSVTLAERTCVSGVRGAIQVKPTALVRPKLLTLLSRKITDSDGILPKIKTGELHGRLSDIALEHDCLDEFNSTCSRLDDIAKACTRAKVNMFIDAEYHEMQPAIHALALITQSSHNKGDCINVWNTQQAYLKETDAANKRHLEIADLSGFRYATKVVRGAYLEYERSRAQSTGRPDPIQSTYADTNASYNRTVDVLLQRAAIDQCGVMVASHNEVSIQLALEKMEKLNVERQKGNVLFGQLYGMCDYISYRLGQNGYRIYKATPYGSIGSTLLYLCRRARENRSILVNGRRERELLVAEWTRRRRDKTRH
ncbi:hydroxyproline dehydrogenase-like [Oscarella lobularis]|uniref:hydroxyproline dehydrogenase-like n=1 Tax=Oscarella lobularis TaxID=121494 RepID=UPI003313F8F5